MILLLAGLQALPHEVKEAAQNDGATGWQSLWKITFPLHAAGQHNGDRVAHHLRLKLADIVINVTAAMPAARQIQFRASSTAIPRSLDVGYATMVAEVYLIIIIIFITLLLNVASRYVRKVT